MTDLERMQNAINWAARASSIQGPATGRAYLIGFIINELRALDDGAPLREPEVK